jgi:hypothetical protein
MVSVRIYRTRSGRGWNPEIWVKRGRCRQTQKIMADGLPPECDCTQQPLELRLGFTPIARAYWLGLLGRREHDEIPVDGHCKRLVK